MRRADVILFAFSCVFAWGVWHQAGVWPSTWSSGLIALAAIALAFTVLLSGAPATALNGRSAFLLVLPLYVICQLVPFPLNVLRWISPQRVFLTELTTPLAASMPAAPISVDPARTWSELANVLGFLLTLWLARALATIFGIDRWRLILPIVGVAFIEAAIAVAQVNGASRLPYARGTYLNQNHFSCLLEMALPFVLAGLLLPTPQMEERFVSTMVRQLICSLLAVLFVSAILLSLSKMGAAIAAILITAGAVLVVGKVVPRGRRWAATAAVVSMLLVAVWLSPRPLWHRFDQTGKFEQDSMQFRLSFWKSTLHMAADYRWVGCGLGAFEPAFARYQNAATAFRVEYAHNDYLNLFAELGIIGSSFAVAAAVVFGWPIFQGLRRERGAFGPLGWSCLASASAMIAHSVVDFNFYVPSNAIALAWVVGIAVGCAEHSLTRRVHARDIQLGEHQRGYFRKA